MDHDNKIKSGPGSQDNKVQIFLQDSINAIRQDVVKNYDLNDEFAKTRKNKDYFVVKIIAAVVVLVALVSWSVTSAINQSSRNVKVDIAVFEDINLKNVLDMAKKAEDKLSVAELKRKSIETDLQSDMSALSLKKQSELDVLSVQRMSDAVRVQKRADVVSTYDAKRKSLNATYAAKIAAADKDIETARKEVNSFDQKRVDEANKQKKMLDNQQDLFELEKQKMQDSYEAELTELRKKVDLIQKENAKLKTAEITTLMNEYQSKIDAIDPSFQDSDASGYVDSVSERDASVPFASAPPSIPRQLDVAQKDFSAIARGYRGVDLLLGKISALPYEHDVGNYAAAARKMAFLSGSANERIINQAFALLNADQSAIEKISSDRDRAEQTAASYETALDAAARANDYAGYVLSVETVTPPAPPAPADDSVAGDQSDGSAPTVAAPAPAAALVPPTPESLLQPKIFFISDVIGPVLQTDNPVVYVYRAPKTLIATLKVTNEDGIIVVSVEKIERNREILPMDFISVKKR